jgi:transformation/transcription domain-associated protein
MIFVKRAAMRAMTASQAQAQAQAVAQAAQPRTETNQAAQSTEIKDVMMSEANTENAPGEGERATKMTGLSLIPPIASGATVLTATKTTAQPETPAPAAPRGAWDHIEEVNQILKTAFPLLILCMETLVDQINSHFKTSGEDEVYRLICMLMQDGIQVIQLSLLALAHVNFSSRTTF